MKIQQLVKKHANKTTITVIDTDSKPVVGVQVLLIAKNNTYFDSKTNTEGDAVFSNLRVKSYSVFLAHVNYPAYVVEEYFSDKDLSITLKKIDGLGSLIIADSTGYIPGLEGRLNPILDTSNRTYLYADNIAIDGGKNQPATFIIGEPVTLEDRNGVSVSVVFVKIQGDSSLLQYKKYSEEVSSTNFSDLKTLNLHMPAVSNVKSQEVNLNKNIASSVGLLERMTNNQTFAVVVGGLVLCLVLYLIYSVSGVDLNDPKQEKDQVVQSPTLSHENKVNVTGTNFAREGFSLNVPRGNKSSCVWTWVAGTASIPGSQITDSTSDVLNLHQFSANFLTEEILR